MTRWAVATAAALGLLALLAVGFVGRPSAPAAPTVPIEKYFELKMDGLVQEVWMEGDMLLARMCSGFMMEGREVPHVSVRVPARFLENSGGYRRLIDGLPPDRFHYIRRGCA